MSGLAPAFRKGGTVTAGNVSGVNDGAAVLLITSDRLAAQLGAKPMARVLSTAAAGVEPALMGVGPVPATPESPGVGRADSRAA